MDEHDDIIQCIEKFTAGPLPNGWDQKLFSMGVVYKHYTGLIVMVTGGVDDNGEVRIARVWHQERVPTDDEVMRVGVEFLGIEPNHDATIGRIVDAETQHIMAIRYEPNQTRYAGQA